jgi:hypothetical protein
VKNPAAYSRTPAAAAQPGRPVAAASVAAATGSMKSSGNRNWSAWRFMSATDGTTR